MRLISSSGLWALLAVATAAIGQPLPVAAQDSALQTFQTSDDSRGWEAVGRLDIDDKGFCTGALIAPDLVLTAAHCLFDGDTMARIDPARIVFRAGLRNGRAIATRGTRRAVIAEGYVHSPVATERNTRFDLALLRLDQPIRLPNAQPFGIGPDVMRGDAVGVVSYARDREYAASLQETCGVIGTQDGALVTSCNVDFGSSGAPIFRIRDGIAEIVSVVSSKAELDGSPVALGAVLSGPLAQLRAAMAEGGAFVASPPVGVRIVAPGQRNDTGAKFVSPAGN